MNIPRKKPRTLSQYLKHCLEFIPVFEKATGLSGDDLEAVSKWVVAQGNLWDVPPALTASAILLRDLKRANREDYITDENGEPVHRRVSYLDEKSQKVFWVKMEKATPEKIRGSAQSRRNGALMDVLQIVRDVAYYNKHFNPGDPIQQSFNFDIDISERQQPTDYPDAPPEDGQPS